MVIHINKSRVWLLVYLFIFIYAPPIVPKLSIIHFLTAYSLLMLIKKYHNYIGAFFKRKPAKAFFSWFLAFTVYMLFMELISYMYAPVALNSYLTMTYKIFMVLIEISVCCAYLYAYCSENSISYEELLSFIIRTAVIQLVIGTAMMCFPSFKRFLVTLMQTNNGGSIDDIMYWEYNRRYFAFSDCMLDMLGWGFGIIAALPFYMQNIKLSYVALAPFLLAIGIMNSTTTIVIYAVMIAGAIAKRIHVKIYTKKQYVILMLLLPFFILISFLIMDTFASGSFSWFINEITSILGRNEGMSSYSKVMRPDIWYFPETMSGIIFGTGHGVYSVKGFHHSDIGYVNIIWLCGIIGMFLLCTSFVRLLVESCKINNRYKMLYIMLILSIFVFQIKGLGISYNPGMACTLLIMLNTSRSNKTDAQEDK